MADIDKMTDEEVEAAWKARRAAAEQKRIAAKAAIGREVREHLNDEYLPDYLRRAYPRNPEYHGLTLQDIFTAGDGRPFVFRHPQTGEEYGGRGMPPDWYQKMNTKDRKACKVYLDEEPAEVPAPAAPAQAAPRRQPQQRRQAAA